MRYPDWYLDQLRERVSIADYAGKRLTFDRRRSRPSAGDYWAPCPFHAEKTASFHIRDREGIFKCFGCGEAGNVFGLCQRLEGLSFGEAVERLAEFAAFPPPDQSPGDKTRSDRRARLLQATAAADAFFRQTLTGRAGASARAYLEGRGLNAEVWSRFGIGLAPDDWTALADALQAKGFSRSELEAAGLVKQGGRSGVIDVFRNRVTFAIADPSGRTIAFGGRALSANDHAKYINSPDSELFHKGATLYRLKEARELLARTKGAGLVVAEGYLDVIAFERAGIPAVAPLGTALTEEQLALVWKFGASPTLCFDGDAAGIRAAHRALDLGCPHFSPTRTLRVALLPRGEDPDDVFRKSGAAALPPLLAAARPAIEALFERERDAVPLDTPEARSDLKQRLEAVAARITDPETRRQYQRAFRDKTFELFRPPARQSGRGRAGRDAPLGPTAELKALAALRSRADLEGIVRLAVDRPALLERGADLFAEFPIEDSDLDAIRHAVLDLWSKSETVDRESVGAHLRAAVRDGAAKLLASWPAARRLEQAGTSQSPASQRVSQQWASDGAEKIEAEWMAFLALDATDPQVKDELALARRCDLDADADAFAAAQAALAARRAVEQAALRREREDAAIEEDARPSE